MIPFCLPELQLRNDWTSESDSPEFPTWGTSKIVVGTPTSPMKIAFDPVKRPAGQPWPNDYVLHRNVYQPATMFAYMTNILFPTQQDIQNCEAYEQDFQINDGIHIFNLGWQFLFGIGLRVWNRSGSGNARWNNTGIPFTFVPNIPVPLIMQFARDLTTVTYLGASINGVNFPLNLTYPAVPKIQTRYMNNAVQLDSKGQGASINLYLNECSVAGF